MRVVSALAVFVTRASARIASRIGPLNVFVDSMKSFVEPMHARYERCHRVTWVLADASWALISGPHPHPRSAFRDAPFARRAPRSSTGSQRGRHRHARPRE